MASVPERLTLVTHRDRRFWWQSVWLRRSLLVVPAVLIVAGLANVFGQRPVTSTSAGSAARLTVYAPKTGRSGLVYAARFRIDARRALRNATIVVDPGWADAYTVNGLAPQPLTEGSLNGRLRFGFGHVPAGQHLTFWLSLQINPTNVGRHAQDVWLYDSGASIAHVARTITIYP